MARGGRRANQAGRPEIYQNSTSINFRCEQALKDEIDLNVEQSDFDNRSAFIVKILSDWLHENSIR
jgi:metal-responsive CopG/Arc/MetJ family transcriptional regulator